MFAFVISLGKLLKLNSGQEVPNNFNQTKRKLVIPLYQREYKWPNDKICGLIADISLRDKFLGNVIIDELDNCYEIADGQQRITTCLLILMCLYNYHQGSPLEQESIKQFIMPINNKPVLVNDSIGSFISEGVGSLSLSIDADQDCYSQKSDFERAYNAIESSIHEIARKGEIDSFKKKLLDCELLVLINDRHTNSNPIEQVFLDINEKAKLLDPEDIFKGHCFEKYSTEYYQRLRTDWVELKKIAISFNKFGFKDLSEYLYLYILETQDEEITKNIAKDLTIKGRHFLDSKSMDQIAVLLQNMINYGKAATELCNNIQIDTYRFINICPDSRRFQDTGDHRVLKKMLSQMMLFSDAIYQKLPLFFFLFKLNNDENLRSLVTHDALKRTITNLYIYNFVFALLGNQKKSKKLIDHSLRDILCAPDCSAQKIVQAAKMLRITQINEVAIPDGEKRSVLFFVDSVIDFYVARDNWMTDIYYDDALCASNLEHFVIPDNKGGRVTWIGNGHTFEMILPKELVSKNKKTQANFVLIDRDLNRQIGRDDIVTKISKIQEWYNKRSIPIPTHVQLYISHVDSCSKYSELVSLKKNGALQDAVEPVYFDFLSEYFNEEKQAALRYLIERKFKDAFKNEQQ